MLPKENRLPSSAIKIVMREGKRVNIGGAQLSVVRNGLPVSRFAILVPGSVDKRAVARNRIRRVAREAVRRALPRIAPGWDCIVFVRREHFNIGDALRAAGLL